MSNKFDLREWWSSYTRKNTYVLALVIFIITTAAYLTLQPNAFEEGVLSRLLTSNFRTWLPVTLLAIGQTFVMLGGGLDLSSGALVSLSNVILAKQIKVGIIVLFRWDTRDWMLHFGGRECRDLAKHIACIHVQFFWSKRNQNVMNLSRFTDSGERFTETIRFLSFYFHL